MAGKPCARPSKKGWTAKLVRNRRKSLASIPACKPFMVDQLGNQIQNADTADRGDAGGVRNGHTWASARISRS